TMSSLGRLTPLLIDLIFGSFHFLMVPMKMPARTGPVSLRPQPTPVTWYGIDVAENAHGIWTQPLQAVAWSGVSGASLAPKSTVRAVICWMPAGVPAPP